MSAKVTALALRQRFTHARAEAVSVAFVDEQEVSSLSSLASLVVSGQVPLDAVKARLVDLAATEFYANAVRVSAQNPGVVTRSQALDNVDSYLEETLVNLSEHLTSVPDMVSAEQFYTQQVEDLLAKLADPSAPVGNSQVEALLNQLIVGEYLADEKLRRANGQEFEPVVLGATRVDFPDFGPVPNFDAPVVVESPATSPDLVDPGLDFEEAPVQPSPAPAVPAGFVDPGFDLEAPEVVPPAAFTVDPGFEVEEPVVDPLSALFETDPDPSVEAGPQVDFEEAPPTQAAGFSLGVLGPRLLAMPRTVDFRANLEALAADPLAALTLWSSLDESGRASLRHRASELRGGAAILAALDASLSRSAATIKDLPASPFKDWISDPTAFASDLAAADEDTIKDTVKELGRDQLAAAHKVVAPFPQITEEQKRTLAKSALALAGLTVGAVALSQALPVVVIGGSIVIAAKLIKRWRHHGPDQLSSTPRVIKLLGKGAATLGQFTGQAAMATAQRRMLTRQGL